MDDPIEVRLRLVVREEVRSLQGTLDAILAVLERDRREATLLTTAQAAEVAHVSVETIRSWIKGGGLPAHRSGRKWLVALADLMARLRGDTLGAVEAAVKRELRVIKLDSPTTSDEHED